MSPGFFVPEPPAGPFRSAGSGKLPPGDSAAKHPAPRMPGLEYPTRKSRSGTAQPRVSGPGNPVRKKSLPKYRPSPTPDPEPLPPEQSYPEPPHLHSCRQTFSLSLSRTAAFHLRSRKISILRNTLLRPQRPETQAFNPILKKFIFSLRRKTFGRFGESAYICHTNKINKANP